MLIFNQEMEVNMAKEQRAVFFLLDEELYYEMRKFCFEREEKRATFLSKAIKEYLKKVNKCKEK